TFALSFSDRDVCWPQCPASCGGCASNQRPATNDQRPAASNQQPATNGDSPAEQLNDFRRPLGVQLHDVAGAHAFEQPLDVAVAQPDTAVRLREADRCRLIGAVNAVALLTESAPAR